MQHKENKSQISNIKDSNSIETKSFTDAISNYVLNMNKETETSSPTDCIAITSEQPKELISKCPEGILFRHVNINYLLNKRHILMNMINQNHDISDISISENKIDNSFSIAQFASEGYSKPYRGDRRISGGGLTLYVNGDIPSR